MARPLRIERGGAWYHVTARGTERRRIFADDWDRRRWLGLLEQAVEMYDLAVHAYVLMENHFHVILETRQANLSRSMQWLQTSHSMGFNRRHGRVGPLFQGRFKAVLVDRIGWGLELSRYVHLNPVRIQRLGLDKGARQADRLGLRGRPQEGQVRERIQRLRRYPWSSYLACVGLEKPPAWLDCGTLLELGGGRGGLPERQQQYRRYVEEAIREGLRESPWEHLQGQLVLGGREFVEQMFGRIRGGHREKPQQGALRQRPDWAAVVQAVEGERGEDWEHFRDRHGDWGRDAALYLGRRQCGLPLSHLGKAAGGMDYAAVSVAIKRFEKRLAEDRQLRNTIKRLRNLLKIET